MSEVPPHWSAHLHRLEVQVGRLSRDLDDVRAALDSREAPSAPGVETVLSERAFATSVDWAHAFLLPTFIRPVGGQIRWCEQWSQHPEAVLRLEAMWRAWESMRLEDGTGMSVYLLHHLDPGLTALTAPTGPFARCTPDRHMPPSQNQPVREATA